MKKTATALCALCACIGASAQSSVEIFGVADVGIETGPSQVDRMDRGRYAGPVGWVDAHGDYLFNFAIGQVRATDIAEDLLQETFLAAVRAQQKFSGRSSERTWLVGILRHKIYDHLRKTCRERAVRVERRPVRGGVV